VNTATFDRLAYIDKLKQAGIGDQHARAHADALDQAFRDEVATKADITALKTDLRQEVQRLEAKIEIGLRDVTLRVGGMIIAAVAILIAIKYFG
jgi:hypothetical protein